MKILQNNPSFKGACGSWQMLSLYENLQMTKENQRSICRETVMTIPLVIYTKKDFYLLDALNEKIEMFKASGLIRFWQYQDVDKALLRTKESREPKVFTINELLGSFKLLFVGLGFSLIGFMIEICFYRLKKN